MSRYIDADITKAKLKEYCVDNDSTVLQWYEMMGIDDCIDNNVPTADVRENVRGEWKDFVDRFTGFTLCRCSNCGRTVYCEEKESMHFCYNCGADMREKKDE